ncbi:MAG: aminoglycoside phosphotransferase family protein [Gemmata sp.]
MNETSPPLDVRNHFRLATAGLAWHRAEPGFSGAVVWRGDDPSGAPQVALKGWPPGVTAERVEQVHAWQGQAALLPFVPRVLPGARRAPAVLADGRVWDACSWMPGEPLRAPTEAGVRAACAAAAQLHRCWPVAERKPCPGVAARLDILTAYRTRLGAWARDLAPVAAELDALLARAARAVERGADAAVTALRPWLIRSFPLRPCLRDLRGDHVLFSSGRLTGVIDYGAMAVDHVAVDLARLLDDLAAADRSLFQAGLAAYRDAGGPLDAPDEFVSLLAATGAMCSALGWLVRVFAHREPVARPAAVAERLGKLVARVERIEHF